MNDIICWLIGSLITISVYLILSQQIMRWVLGIVILSSTINLIIFVSGRLYSQHPAFITLENSHTTLANPLPQALILTAIVISFGLLIFALVLVRKVWLVFHTTNIDAIHYPEAGYLTSEENEI